VNVTEPCATATELGGPRRASIVDSGDAHHYAFGPPVEIERPTVTRSKRTNIPSAVVGIATVAVLLSGGASSAAPARPAAPAVRATNAYIDPGYQAKTHTATAYWTGTGTYSGTFYYGVNGQYINFAQSSLSRSFQYASPHPCSSTTYSQALDVRNVEGSAPTAYAQTAWNGGSPC